jgi:mRNA interferase HicA
LLDYLQRKGCLLVREGSRHSVFENPAFGVRAPAPRHGEIDNNLARRICVQLKIAAIQ